MVVNNIIDYIKYNEKKVLTLLFVIFFLGNIIAGSFAIRMTNDNMVKEIKKSIRSEATVMLKDGERIENLDTMSLTSNMLEGISKLTQVSDYNFEMNTLLGVENYTTTMGSMADNLFALNARGVTEPSFYDLRNDRIKIVEGGIFTSEEIEEKESKVLISKKFAQDNDLKVGSPLHLVTTIYDKSILEKDAKLLQKKDLNFEIIGIFDVNEELENEYSELTGETINVEALFSDVAFFANGLLHDIITELDQERIDFGVKKSDASSFYDLKTTYILKSQDDMQQFKEQADILLPDEYEVKFYYDSFQEVISPLNSLNRIADFLFIVSVFSTMVILSLMLYITIFERKKELGIYIALGRKKMDIFLQLLEETMVIIFVAVLLAGFTGSLLVANFSDKVINRQLITQEETSVQSNSSVLQKDNMKILENYHVEITPTFFAIYILLFIIITFISMLIPTVILLKLNPKKLLL